LLIPGDKVQSLIPRENQSDKKPPNKGGRKEK